MNTRNNVLITVMLSLSISACERHAPDPAALKAQVKEIADTAWQHALDQSLSLRMKYGLPVEKLPDLSLQHAQREADSAQALIERIDAIPNEEVDHDDQLTLAIVRWQAENTVKEPEFYWLHFPVTPYTAAGTFRTVHRAFSQYLFDSEVDTPAYLKLLGDYQNMLDHMLTKLQGQDERGILLPKPEIPAVVEMFEAYRANCESVLSLDEGRLGKLDAEAQQRLIVHTKTAISSGILPTYERLLDFLKGDYSQRAPEAVGYSQYPNGDENYSHLVRRYTTLDLTPEEIHELGLSKVGELSQKMQSIRDDLGFKGTQAEFHQELRNDPRFLAKTPEEVEERYMSYIRRIEPLIGQYFSTLPKAPYGVRRLQPEAEASMTFGYYQQPTPDNEVGEYRYNGSKLESRPLVMAGPIIFHELIPGHHFHIAGQNENSELPLIRREFTGAGAFNEGWGNYSAKLASEIGLLSDPYDQYAMAIFDMFISVRLVVDTGMNCFGWSLERARDYMRQHVFQSETQIQTESLRYSVDLPAQALGYKVGLEKILELREKAKTALGARFDIRDFHEAMLESGAMPLSVLEKHIDWFIEQQLSLAEPNLSNK